MKRIDRPSPNHDDRGAVVLSKLESATLEELANATNGVYRDASSWVDLAALLKTPADDAAVMTCGASTGGSFI